MRFARARRMTFDRYCMNPTSPNTPEYLVNFDVLRLVFAVLVIFSHSFELLRVPDPVQALILTTSLGQLSVDGFFLISGYLITASWLSDPSIGRFLARRVLRLYPAFIVASFASVLIVGPLGADAAQYFRELEIGRFLRGVLTLQEPHTPRVFAGTSIESVNGAMWTISFEFRCYLLVIVCGLVGLFRHRLVLLTVAAIVGVAICVTVPASGPTDSQHMLFGLKILRVSDFMAWFVSLFLTGSSFYLFRERIRYTLVRWLLACAALAASLFHPDLMRPGVLLAGSYVVFGAASAQSLLRPVRRGHIDLSYGMYLYGWPVQKLLSWCWSDITPWVLFVCTLVVCVALAAVSWRLIEEPALRLKPCTPRRVKLQTEAGLGERQGA